MLLFIAAIVVGIVALTWSADRFVEGACGAALKFNISPLIVGMTIVAIGTSAPEILVSVMAVLEGVPTLAVGNAVGSNIANIGLALGISAVVLTIPLKSQVKRRAVPALVAMTAVGIGISIDGKLDFFDGLIALAAGALATGFASQGAEPEEVPEGSDQLGLWKSLSWLTIGLAVLLGSSRLLVWGASGAAIELGVPEVIVGLTIVAIGTSLPEVAASVAGALKGHPEIAIGNVVGSNIFNMGGVFAVAGLMTTVSIDSVTLTRDFGLMLGMTLIVAVLAWTAGRLNRVAGLALLAVYTSYLGYLGWSTL